MSQRSAKFSILSPSCLRVLRIRSPTCIASFERTCVERLFPFDFATAYLSSSKQQVLSLKRVHVAAKTFNRI